MNWYSNNTTEDNNGVTYKDFKIGQKVTCYKVDESNILRLVKHIKSKMLIGIFQIKFVLEVTTKKLVVFLILHIL